MKMYYDLVFAYLNFNLDKELCIHAIHSNMDGAGRYYAKRIQLKEV